MRRPGAGLLPALVGSADLPAELERRLLARAEGNPFYLEELVGSLVDSGALVRDGDGGWRFDREVPVDLPETVEKVILARIDRLSEPAHELLSRRRRPRPPVPGGAPGGGREAGAGSREALRELERAGLLRDGGRMPAPMLIFKHALIQESAYRSLLKRRRQELHREALDALARLYPERRDEFLGMLAHHAGRAGEDERALGFHVEAGDAARRIFSAGGGDRPLRRGHRRRQAARAWSGGGARSPRPFRPRLPSLRLRVHQRSALESIEARPCRSARGGRPRGGGGGPPGARGLLADARLRPRPGADGGGRSASEELTDPDARS